MRKRILAIPAIVFLILSLALSTNAASLAKVMTLPIWVGEGKERVKIRVGDIFKDTLDWALTTGGYAINDPLSFTTVLTNLPTEFKGVLLAKIEMERHYAYRRLMEAEDEGYAPDKKYFGRMVERLEAAKTWIATGDGTDLSRLIARAREEKAPPEKQKITTASSELLHSTGYFKSREQLMLPFRDNSLFFEVFLNEHGIPQIRGDGKIKIQMGEDYVYFYFRIKRGEIRDPDPSKTYLNLSEMPKRIRWEIYGRIDLEMSGQNAPFDGSIQGEAYLNGNSITGKIYGQRGYMNRLWPAGNLVIDALPGTLDFETSHYF